ncbi:two-component system, sensor histidine kinase [Anaerolineae bacterium]|nr:two-component system, sensor histidine kinase [Anaerolineae bacterium]
MTEFITNLFKASNPSVTHSNQFSVRTRLLVFLFLAIAALIIIQSILQINTAQQNMQAEIHHTLRDDAWGFISELDNKGVTTLVTARSIADRADVQALARSQDRQGLIDLLTPLFETLHTQHGIGHLYIHDPKGTVIVRLHNPTQFGDNVAFSRRTTGDAIDKRAATVGVELGPNFIGLRGVVPMFNGSTVIGLVEVGIDLGADVMKSLKEGYDSDYTLWLLKDIADTARFDYTNRPVASPLDSLFYYDSTNPQALPIEASHYDYVLTTDEQIELNLSSQGENYAVLLEPLHGYGNRIFGVLEISYGLQSTLAKLRTDQINVVLISALLMGITLAIFWVTINQVVIKPLYHLTDVTQRQIGGDLQARAADLGKNEFGALATSFNSLSTKVNELLDEQKASLVEREKLIAQLREASRLKSEFLSTMSHELRTPLNAMIGFNEILLSGKPGDLNTKQRHQLERMHANSLRLLNLIDDVLDLSRIEAGRADIHEAPFSLKTLVDKVQAETASLVAGKPFDFSVVIDPQFPERIVGDSTHIEQVMLNLLSNAFKFTQQGEVVLMIKLGDTPKTWQFSVRDTGIGIPPHALEYIFEEFRQLDGSSRRAYGGSGLGLAISRHLCRQMNGEISVQSVVGKGSTFTVRLPLETESEYEAMIKAQGQQFQVTG